MRITLDSAQYNSSLYSSITLRDSSCYATISGSSILAGSTPGNVLISDIFHPIVSLCSHNSTGGQFSSLWVQKDVKL